MSQPVQVEPAEPPPDDEPGATLEPSSTYTPVTVRGGQGTGGRAGDRGGETPEAGGQGAGVARARARGASVARLLGVTQRGGGVSQSRIALDVRDLTAGARDDVADLWRYVRGETWMRGSDNKGRRRAGRVFAALVMTPTLFVAHLVSGLVVLALDVVVLVTSRFAIALTALAIGAAVWGTWPSSVEPAPPTAETLIVSPGGAR